VLLAGAYVKHEERLSKFGHKVHAGTCPVTALIVQVITSGLPVIRRESETDA
jgi:hypothetical protein